MDFHGFSTEVFEAAGFQRKETRLFYTSPPPFAIPRAGDPLANFNERVPRYSPEKLRLEAYRSLDYYFQVDIISKCANFFL